VLEIFRQDKSYLAWLNAHPEGLVVNTRRDFSPDYAILHRATCPSIQDMRGDYRDDPFTGHDYVKVCANGLEQLDSWHQQHGIGALKPCERCRPDEAGSYWVLVCNPRSWAVDRFLEQRIERDTWGIRQSDQRRFAPGQLALHPWAARAA
jgi:hypothetical protein